MPAAIAGTYVSADSRRHLARRAHRRRLEVQVSGPLIAGGTAWPVRGVDADTVEIESPTGWITATQLAHLVRDRGRQDRGAEVSTGRIKKMRFERQA